jgi:hypothetical protein
MRRLGLFIALVVVLAAAADAIGATVRAGRYEGLTKQGQFLKFDVTRDRRHVVQFAVGAVVVKCPDENQTALPISRTSRSRRYKLDARGRFRIVHSSRRAAESYVVSGQVKGRRATGTLRMKQRVTPDYAPDPGGTVTCDSGTVGWSAKLKK